MRLNEGFAAGLVALSQAPSLALMSALALAASALVPPPLTSLEAALPRAPPAGAFARAACALAAGALAAATVYVRLAGRGKRGAAGAPRGSVRMTLKTALPAATPVQELLPLQEEGAPEVRIYTISCWMFSSAYYSCFECLGESSTRLVAPATLR